MTIDPKLNLIRDTFSHFNDFICKSIYSKFITDPKIVKKVIELHHPIFKEYTWLLEQKELIKKNWHWIRAESINKFTFYTLFESEIVNSTSNIEPLAAKINKEPHDHEFETEVLKRVVPQINREQVRSIFRGENKVHFIYEMININFDYIECIPKEKCYYLLSHTVWQDRHPELCLRLLRHFHSSISVLNKLIKNCVSDSNIVVEITPPVLLSPLLEYASKMDYFVFQFSMEDVLKLPNYSSVIIFHCAIRVGDIPTQMQFLEKALTNFGFLDSILLIHDKPIDAKTVTDLLKCKDFNTLCYALPDLPVIARLMLRLNALQNLDQSMLKLFLDDVPIEASELIKMALYAITREKETSTALYLISRLPFPKHEIIWHVFVICKNPSMTLVKAADKLLVSLLAQHKESDHQPVLREILHDPATLYFKEFIVALFKLSDKESKKVFVVRNSSKRKPSILFEILRTNNLELSQAVLPCFEGNKLIEVVQRKALISNKQHTILQFITRHNRSIFKELLPMLDDSLVCKLSKSVDLDCLCLLVSIHERYVACIPEQEPYDDFPHRELYLVLKIAIEKHYIDTIVHIFAKRAVTEVELSKLITHFFNQSKKPHTLAIALLNQISCFNNKPLEFLLVDLLLSEEKQVNVIEWMRHKFKSQNKFEYVDLFLDYPFLIDLMYDASTDTIQKYLLERFPGLSPAIKLQLIPFWDIPDIIELSQSVDDVAQNAKMEKTVKFIGFSGSLKNSISHIKKKYIKALESGEHPETMIALSNNLDSYITILSCDIIAAAPPGVKAQLVPFLPYLPLSKATVLVPLLSCECLNNFLKHQELGSQLRYFKLASTEQKESYIDAVGFNYPSIENWRNEKHALRMHLERLENEKKPNIQHCKALQKAFKKHNKLINEKFHLSMILGQLRASFKLSKYTSDKTKQAYKAFKGYVKREIAECEAMQQKIDALVAKNVPQDASEPAVDPFTKVKIEHPVTLIDSSGQTLIVDQKTADWIRDEFNNVNPNTKLKIVSPPS